MKPTEVRAVVKLLEQEHEDVEELAKEVIKTLDVMRSDDRLYVLAVTGSGPLEVWGPYPTALQAVKGAPEAVQGRSGASYKPVYLFRPGVGDPQDRQPAVPCTECGHPSWTHGFPRGIGCAIQVGEDPQGYPVYCRCKE